MPLLLNRLLAPALLVLPLLMLPLLAPAGTARAQGLNAQRFSAAQRQEIIAIVRDALRRDPTLLRDALAALETEEQQGREGQVRAAIAARAAALFRDAADPVRGNPAGAITLVEFFDARCPYCKRMIPALNELVRRNPDVRVVLKDMPILGANSTLASRALLAAQRQGKYHEYHDAVLSLREEPTEPVLQREAEQLGLNWITMLRDMADPAVQRRLDATLALARELGVEGTPAFIIGDRLVPGAVDLAGLEALVAAARAPVR